VPWSSPQTQLLERTLDKKRQCRTSPKDAIETIRLCASLLQTPLSITIVSSLFL
jgi:hypothetical protein